MYRFLKTFLPAAMVGMILASCNDSDYDYDRPDWGAYVTVKVDGNSYFFVGDDGETFFPGDVSRIGRYNTEDKDGKRAYIYFNYLLEEMEGFDHNVALYEVVDILTKDVEVARSTDTVTETGDDPLSVHYIKIQGQWLDITFSLWTEYGYMHKMTLLDNQTVDAPQSMPEDYQYLEFRQMAKNNQNVYMGTGLVAFELGEYHPAVTGKSGLYIRIKGLDGQIEYITVKYNAAEENTVSRGTAPTVSTTITR